MSAINSAGNAGGGSLPDKRYQKQTVVPEKDTKQKPAITHVTEQTRKKVNGLIGTNFDATA